MAVNPKLIIDALMKLFGGAKKQVPMDSPNAPRTLPGNRANTDHPDFDPGEFYGGNLPERRNLATRPDELPHGFYRDDRGRVLSGDLDIDHPNFSQDRFSGGDMAELDEPLIRSNQVDSRIAQEAEDLQQLLLEQIARGENPDPRVLEQLRQINPELADNIEAYSKTPINPLNDPPAPKRTRPADLLTSGPKFEAQVARGRKVRAREEALNNELGYTIDDLLDE